MELLAQTYVHDVLHIIAQALMVPTLVVLILLIVYMLWTIGSVLVEAITERRHFKIHMGSFINSIEQAHPDQLPEVVSDSNLLAWQKRSLLRLWDHRCLDVESHLALGKRIIEEQESRRFLRIDINSTISRIAPQLGLMATLIPLGPGIVALSDGDTATLSSSLLVAFDATVAGLLVSAISFVVSRIRRTWYNDYMSALEASCTAILEKVDEMRRAGDIDIDSPSDHASAFPDPHEERDLERVRKWKARKAARSRARSNRGSSRESSSRDEGRRFN